MTEKPITLCALLYGDHPELAQRCLGSILERLGEGSVFVRDIRLGLNEISNASRAVVRDFGAAVHNQYGMKVTLYDCPRNAYKYPLMRRMLLDENRPAKWVMWFDDDSYLDGKKGWWNCLMQGADLYSMVGKIYWFPLHSSLCQWEWIKKQAWYNPAAGMPPPPPKKIMLPKKRPTFKFCTGGWWMARSSIFIDHDWPTKECKLVGGDTMLGELCRHQHYSLCNFHDGVKINTGLTGDNTAPPRGESPESRGRDAVRLGIAESPGPELHEFICERIEY